jgi:TonB family protein
MTDVNNFFVRLKRLLKGASLILMLSTIAICQNNEDIFDAKIVSTPVVVIPPEVKETGIGGPVGVLVKINTKGEAVDVERVGGPGPVCSSVDRADVVAIRRAAKTAALGMKFEPATKKGQPIDSTLWVTFNFPQKPKDGKGDEHYTAAPVTDITGVRSVAVPKMITGGVVNGKALKLPAPVYPPAAKAVRASGTVEVRVLIDEEGSIFSAEALSGHPLLRSAARQAACEAKFSTTRLEGHQVKVSGVITYNIFNP